MEFMTKKEINEMFIKAANRVLPEHLSSDKEKEAFVRGCWYGLSYQLASKQPKEPFEN